jgi:hypothetical protein
MVLEFKRENNTLKVGRALKSLVEAMFPILGALLEMLLRRPQWSATSPANVNIV